MRVRHFTAATMHDALAEVRKAMGEDAVIISNTREKGGRGVRVTAAVEEPEPEWPVWNAAPSLPETSPSVPSNDDARAPDDPLFSLLHAHRLPPVLAHSLLDATRLSPENAEASERLAAALEAHLTFSPLAMTELQRPVMLVGMPGAGKTIATAKLLIHACMNRLPVRVITTDTKKAGGVAQLAAFTDILTVPLITASTPDALYGHLKEAPEGTRVVIDSAGVNPFDALEMAALRDLLAPTVIEPVLVLPAGGDSAEGAEIAEAFRALRVKRMIASQCDLARRMGNVLAVAEAAGLALAALGDSPNVAESLVAPSPARMAYMLTEKAAA